MRQKSTILIVDDELNIHDIFKSVFSKDDYNLVFAENGVEALEKAKSITLDLILLDLMMPEMDGFEVCRRLRADPLLAEVPVIMVTTMFDRETRLMGIKAGVDDFITKPFDIEELESRVKTITRLNRYRKLLVERSKSESLIELSPEGIIIVDVEGVITLVNSATKKMLGSEDVKDIVGKKLESFFMPERTENCSNFLDEVTNSSSHHRVETSFVRLDGERLPIEIIAASIDWNDEPSVYIMVRDVTERKRAQEALKESEDRFRTLIESSSDAIAIVDIDGNMQYLSQSNVHVQGDKPEDLIGTSFSDLIHPDDLKGLIEVFSSLLNKKEDSITATYRCRHKDGSWRTMEAISRNFLDDPNIRGIITNYRDITERKRAEEALKENEEKYRSLVENLNDVIFTLDLEGNITYVSPIAEKLSGYKSEEFLNQPFFKYIHPDDLSGLMNSVQRTLVGEMEPYEYRFLVKDGTYKHVLSSSQVIFQDGQPVGLVGIIKDITERKEAEEALKDSEEKYRILVENIQDLVFSLDLQGNITYVSPIIEKLSGYKPEDLLNQPFLSFVHPDDLPVVIDSVEQKLAGRDEPLEYRILVKDGSYKHVLSSSKLMFIDDQPVGLVGIAKDITDRKIALDKLRQEKERAQQYLDIVEEILVALNTRGEITLINRKGNSLLGYEEGELLGKNWFETCIADDLKDEVTGIFQEVIKGDSKTHEYNINHVITKDGEERVVAWHNVVLRDEEDNVVGVLGSGEDITDRIIYERKIEESEKKYSNLLSNIGDIVYILDEKGKLVFANEALERSTGFTIDEILNKNFAELIHPSSYEDAIDVFKRQLAGENLGAFEIRLLNNEGQVIILEVKQRLVWEGDRVVEVHGIGRDITDRKRADEALRHSEAQLSNALRIARAGHWEYDVASDTFTFNDNFYRIFRTTAEEMGGYQLSSADYARRFCHPDDTSLVSKEVQAAIETTDPNFSRQLEHRILYDNGEVGYIAVRFLIVKDEQGRTVKTYGVNQDITDRYRAEEALHQYEHIVSSSTDMMILIDKNYRYLAINKEYVKVFERTPEDVIGKSVADIMGKEFFETIVKPNADRCLKGEEVVYQDWFDFPGYGHCYMHYTYNPYYSEDNEITGIVLSGRNITDLKLAEEALKESEDRFRTLIEYSSDAIAIVKDDGTMEYVSPSNERVQGDKPEDLIGTNFVDIIHPDDLEGLVEVFSNLLNKKEGSITATYRCRHKDGSWRTMEAISRDFLDDPKIRGIVTNYRDITERKKAEEKLIENEERYRSLVENLNDVVFNIDLKGNFTYLSPIIEQISGYKVNEIIGKLIANFIHPDDLPGFHEMLRHGIENRKEPYEFRAIDKDGGIRYINTSGRVQWKDGKPIGITGIMTDVTDSWMMREELKAAKIRAEESNRAKSEFLANMSHEIRTPMNAILGFSELLLEENLMEEQRENIKTIYDSGNILLSLINDILDLSKIESGKTEVHEEVFYLLELLNNAIALFHPKAEEKGLNLNLKIDKDISSQIVSDPDKIRQIIINLVGNAIKFSDAGKIDVSVKMREVDDEKDVLTISVKDTGIGIPSEKIEAIFDPFSQVDASTTRRYGGTGLGLNITKNLVELLGGKIKVSSKEGKGSTFTFSLPVNKPATDDRELQIAESKKVLIVEDDASTLRLYKKFLERDGYEVISSKIGRDALPLAEKHLPAIIILDVILPDIIGWEVLRQLKKSEKVSNIPVVVVSVLPEKDKAISLGAIDYAEKPITGGSLVKKIEALTKSKKQKIDLKIVIVDDDKPVLEFLSEMLEEEGFTTIPFSDPEEAINFIKAEDSIDMIILDIYMPKISGFDFMSLLKEEGELKDIPIIFVTGRTMSEKEMKKFSGISYTLMQKSQLTTELVVSEIDTVLKRLKDVSEKPAEKAPPEIKEKPTGNILLVEDNKVNQKLITKILRNEGYKVSVTGNGAQALKAIETEDFDLVLMDIQMPVMDGYEATQRIKADKRFNSIPVVALTAHAMSGDEQKIKEAGCDGYLTKPIKREKLFKELAYQLKSKREEDLTYEDEDDEELKEIYRDYLSSLPGELAKLNKAVSKNDFDNIYKIGHDLKGTGGAFGQEKISILGGQIEHAAKEKKAEVIKFLLESLAEETDRIMADLK